MEEAGELRTRALSLDVYEKYSKGWKAQLQTLGQGVAQAKTMAAEEAEHRKP